MKPCVIIGASPWCTVPADFSAEGCTVICADGGYETAQKLGKRIAYPLCISESEMTAMVPGENAWAVGRYGIPEPIPEHSAPVPPEELDFVLCPCTVFDERCNRVNGRGLL